MEKLNDKIVLIVGATGGIGSAAAKQLHTSGAKVFITSRSAEKLNNLTIDFGLPKERGFILDFEKEETISLAVDAILAKESKIDILINLAGVGIIKNFDLLTVEDMRRSMQVNLIGPFLLLQSVLPSMKEQKKGLIINIPGVLGKTPMAGAAAYSASKYGINGMMKSLREELKRTEIRITQLFLGGVDSPFWDTIDLKVQRDKMIIAEEAGKTIWYLCQQPANAVVSEMVIQPFNHQAI